jgi:hypothetical protein
MELGLFMRNFQAPSNGSSTIARRQFLNALSLLSARSCEPECSLGREDSIRWMGKWFQIHTRKTKISTT